MSNKERIMLECRYILSLSKSYKDISKYLQVSEETVYHDLNDLLPKIDTILYQKVKKYLNHT